MKLKQCKDCKKMFGAYSNLQVRCSPCDRLKHPVPLLQQNKLKPRSGIKQKKPLNKHGPVFRKWLKTRDKWFEQNKAPYYACYLCGKIMTRSQLTLDHVRSRTRAPELRYVLSNLEPCCYNCNQNKGSRDLSEL